VTRKLRSSSAEKSPITRSSKQSIWHPSFPCSICVTEARRNIAGLLALSIVTIRAISVSSSCAKGTQGTLLLTSIAKLEASVVLESA